MGRWTFELRLARRELRSGIRRLGPYMTSIALGVAALVAVHAFRDDVARAVRERSEVLLGADARLSADRPLPDSVTSVVDSLRAAGARTARVTTAASMVLAPRSGAVRLLQVRGVEGGYPFYGAVRTRPEGLWRGAPSPGEAFVDPAVLTQLQIGVGDSLAVGRSRFRVVATVEDLPTDLGFQAAVGPRVYVSEKALGDAGLLGFGSLARFETFLALPSRRDGERVEDRYRSLFGATGVRWVTARDQARRLTRAVDHLGRYLGLVGLGALLLGGVGVASAVHVFVKEKLIGVAVLRCLGARQWAVFRSYLLQAAILGSGGAAVGVAVGLAVQRALPSLLGGVLPVEVEPRLAVGAALAGLGTGLWVAVLFALVPLLAVRDVPPLRALRRDVEGRGRSLDAWRLAALSALGASVAGLAVVEARDAGEGLAFAAALAVVTGCLWLTGWAAVRVTRRVVPRRARYPVRQGVANLFRPQNQTVAVILALGFGLFVPATVVHVQSSLAAELAFDLAGGRPNLLLFDIQPDQADGVLSLLPPGPRETATVDPIVPARITGVRGRRAEDLRRDSTGRRVPRWALRREYRNTWRADLRDSEALVAGSWWDGSAEEELPGRAGSPSGSTAARISMEADLAADLGVGLGDHVTWDVEGREIESVVTSLRSVDWERFETNFFVVFEPGSLDDAPHTDVVLTRLPDATRRAAFLRELVERYPNVSALDVTQIEEALEEILGTVDRAVRFLALFTALAGLLVLAGAVAASRSQRLREGALLKTLGARRAQVLGVLLAEYAVLGVLAALVGLGLATLAADLLVTRFFGVDFAPAPGALGLAAGTIGLTVAVGVVGSRGVLGRAPLPILRELGE